MARLALMTAGLLQEASGHPRMQDFVDAGDPTFSAAEARVYRAFAVA